jgi:hypothetical protein
VFLLCSQAAWISACVAAGCAVLASIIGIPFLRWRIRRKVEQRDTDNANALEAASNDQEKARLEMIVGFIFSDIALGCLMTQLHAPPDSEQNFLY